MNLIEKMDHHISESSHFGDPLYDAYPKLRAVVIAAKSIEWIPKELMDHPLWDALDALEEPCPPNT